MLQGVNFWRDTRKGCMIENAGRSMIIKTRVLCVDTFNGAIPLLQSLQPVFKIKKELHGNALRFKSNIL